jgi:hypothetical protein
MNRMLRTACLLAAIAAPCGLAVAQTTVETSVTVYDPNSGPKTVTTVKTCTSGGTCTTTTTIAYIN